MGVTNAEKKLKSKEKKVSFLVLGCSECAACDEQQRRKGEERMDRKGVLDRGRAVSMLMEISGRAMKSGPGRAREMLMYFGELWDSRAAAAAFECQCQRQRQKSAAQGSQRYRHSSLPAGPSALLERAELRVCVCGKVWYVCSVRLGRTGVYNAMTTDRIKVCKRRGPRGGRGGMYVVVREGDGGIGMQRVNEAN